MPLRCDFSDFCAQLWLKEIKMVVDNLDSDFRRRVDEFEFFGIVRLLYNMITIRGG